MTVSGEGDAVPRTLVGVFWAQVVAFLLLIANMLVMDGQSWIRLTFLSTMGACLVLGLILLVLAALWKRRGLLRTFWILAGAATTGIAAGSVLHNVFYALATLAERWPLLHGALGVLEGAFFLIAVIACPVAFLVGTVGAIWVLIRRRSVVTAAP